MLMPRKQFARSLNLKRKTAFPHSGEAVFVLTFPSLFSILINTFRPQVDQKVDRKAGRIVSGYDSPQRIYKWITENVYVNL